jgi:hypothetical protein
MLSFSPRRSSAPGPQSLHERVDLIIVRAVGEDRDLIEKGLNPLGDRTIEAGGEATVTV